MGHASSWLVAWCPPAVLKQERDKEHDPENRADIRHPRHVPVSPWCSDWSPATIHSGTRPPNHLTQSWEGPLPPPSQAEGGPARVLASWFGSSKGAQVTVWVSPWGNTGPGHREKQVRSEKIARPGVGALQTEAAQDSQLHPHQPWDCGRATWSSCTPVSPS